MTTCHLSRLSLGCVWLYEGGQLEAALDMLHYNGSKAAWDSSSIEPSSSSLVLLGSYDALLSLRALGTVITTLGRAAAGSGEE